MLKTPHILMLFLDGVGIGRKDAHVNPFFAAKMPTLNNLLNGKIPHSHDAEFDNSTISLTKLNATLGMQGLPQSGTGQTALLTGINAPRVVGRHFGPYLYSSLKQIVAEKSIFNKLQITDKRSYYANAFPRQYFEYLKSSKNRSTAITQAWITSGNELNDGNSLTLGNALSADITNERWHELGYPEIPIITPQQAGKRLVNFTREHEFVLFEYYFTDHAGHSQSMKEAIHVLEKLDGLIEGILDSFDYESMLFLLTSDHGNLEDLSTKSHTRNPVPLLAVGQRHREMTKHAKNLTHVAPSILNILK